MCLDKLKQAFSIFELSIVIIILGFISINFISIIDSLLKIDKIKITNGKIAKIEEAIIVYYDKNSYLPCPDSFNIRNDKKFNKNSNYNSALSAKCLGANKIRVDNKLTAFYGSIPVDVLNLPIEYKFDGWNNQFSLIVAANYISQEFELALDKLKESSFPIIYNKSGATEILYKYNNIAFLIISYGQNGFGAYNKLGRKNDFNSSTIDEKENFDGDAIFIYDYFKGKKLDDILLFNNIYQILIKLRINGQKRFLTKDCDFLTDNLEQIKSLCL